MSADNWAICPRCLEGGREAHDEAVQAVMATYGKIPVDEFDAKRAALPQLDPEKFRTFREDYEFYGADAGEVVADYSGHCSQCGLGVDFSEHRKFWP